MAKIGHYEILGELGRGAMGVVFRGFDPAIGRPVAIKVIKAQSFSTLEEIQEARLRFAREAAAAGKLSHPNIVTVYHLGEERDYQYLAMELVEGKPLAPPASGGETATPTSCLPLLRQVAGALDYAHTRGVFHRDIKPANILVDVDGQVKITDFGIARIATQTMTRTGVTMGTPAYMAPEQVLAARVDGKADQFSLAVVAFELLTGRRPFQADTDHAIMFAIVSGERPVAHEVNPALPPAVSEVLRRALAKEGSQRFAGCAQFVAALDAAFTPPAVRPGVADRSAPVQPPPGQVAGRRALLVGVAAGAAFAAVLLAGAYALMHRNPEAPSVQEKQTVKATPQPPPASEPGDQAGGRPGREAAVQPAPRTLNPKPSGKQPTETKPAAPTETTAVKQPPVAPLPAAARQPRTGEVKLNARDGQNYVWIPPGTFAMGCSQGDGECYYGEETPAHQVTLTKGFWMGQTEATQEAYQKMTGQNPSGFKGAKLPVESINWNEAQAFCQAAGMRLPTEAEWEYAARAGSRNARPGEIDAVAWYTSNSTNTTHPVGQKAANAFGLFDMLGNVWEWIADWYGDYQASEERDPRGPGSGQVRLARSGSWDGPARVARVSFRLGFGPGYRNRDIGLRCAGEIP